MAALVVWVRSDGLAQLPEGLPARVDQVFQAYDRSDSPGCALGIYRDGQLAYARGYGMANLDLGVALQPSTIFDIGSTSKQFTAFSVALLARDGVVSLDDPVRKHVPELGDHADRVTLRHLIHHTSGLRDYLTLMWLAGVRFDDVTTDDDALALITRQQAANFEPGAEYLYSNTGYFLLSVVVRRATGQSLRAFAGKRVFGPLGMRRTHFHDDHAEVVPGRATGYDPAPGGGYSINLSGFEQTGDGAVYTSVEELLRWDENFYSFQVGGRELVDAMQLPGSLRNGEPLDYASGLVIGRHRGLRTVRHGGSWAGYRAELLRFPEVRTSVAVLCNRGDANPSRLADQVAGVVLADRLDPVAAPSDAPAGEPAITLARSVLALRTGVWLSPTTGDVRRISLVEDRLVVGVGDTTSLIPLAVNRFRTPAGTILTFDQGPDGAELRLERNGRPLDRLVRQSESRMSNAELSQLAGSWYAEELGTSWDLAASGDTLRVLVRGRRLTDLFATLPGGFSDGSLHLTFDRTSRPGRFTIQAGRVRGIRFVRR